MYLIIAKSSSQEKAVLPCNFGVFHNKKGEKNCIVLSPCCIKTTWAYLEWSSTTLVNKTLTKRIWFKFGDVVEPVWRVWTFFGAASELSVMLKGQKSHLTKINTYQIFFKDVSDLKACLDYCEDPARSSENLNIRYTFRIELNPIQSWQKKYSGILPGKYLSQCSKISFTVFARVKRPNRVPGKWTKCLLITQCFLPPTFKHIWNLKNKYLN